MNSRRVWKSLIITFMVVLSVVSVMSIFQREGSEFWSDPAMESVRTNYAAFNIFISTLCAVGAFGMYIEREWGKGIVIGLCTGLFFLATIVPIAISFYLNVAVKEAIFPELIAIGIMSLAIAVSAKKLPQRLKEQS